MSGSPDVLLLFERMKAAKPSAGEQSFVTVNLPRSKTMFLGKDAEETPVFLIEIADKVQAVPSFRVRLENIEINQNLHCRIEQNKKTREGQFVLVKFCGRDGSLREQFLRVVFTALSALPASPSVLEVVAEINRLIELFRKVEQGAGQTVQGLWAELLVIDQAKDAEVLVSCWHEGIADTFDFSSGEFNVDVKSSRSSKRVHSFSFEQLSPAHPDKSFILSLTVERDAGGRSVADLSESIRKKLDGNYALQAKLERLLLESLGAEWEAFADDRFSVERALDSMACYCVTDVPRISGPLPPEIANVKYTSDLSKTSRGSLVKVKSELLGSIWLPR